MGEIHIARIAELERQLSGARANADSAAAQAAELQRALRPARPSLNPPCWWSRARRAAAFLDEEAVALQAWRLRYFEQRVRYLESAAPEAATPKPAPEPASAGAGVARARGRGGSKLSGRSGARLERARPNRRA